MDGQNPFDNLLVALIFATIFYQALRWTASALKASPALGRYATKAFYRAHITRLGQWLKQTVAWLAGAVDAEEARLRIAILELVASGWNRVKALSRATARLGQGAAGARVGTGAIGWVPDAFRYALLFQVHYG